MDNDDQGRSNETAPAEPDVKEGEVTNKGRSADYGEAGQHAPGGYYNQQGTTSTERIDLDEQVDSALKNEG